MRPHSAQDPKPIEPVAFGRGLLRRPLGWAAFIAVEVGAEFARRHMLETHAGALSSPTAALVAVTLWTYLAHTRFTFRGTPNTGLDTAPMYISLSLTLAIIKDVLETPHVANLYASWGLAAALTAKFFALKYIVWPRDRNDLQEGDI